MTDPGKPTAALRQGMDLHRSGRFEEARCLYREHLRDQPGDTEALCLLAALEGQGGNHGAAEDIYRQAIAADEGCAAAHSGLGTSLLLQNRPGEAAPVLREAVRLMPDQPETRLQLSLALQRCRRLTEAIEVVERLLERWPDHLAGRHSLGVLLSQCEQPDAAANQFRQVVDRDPSRYMSWLSLGRALLAANDLPGAEEALERAAALAPQSPEPKVLLGTVLRARGRYGDSRAAFDAALADDPEHLAAIVGLAEVDLSEGRPDRGLQRLREVLSPEAPTVAAMRTMGKLLLADGRPVEAISHIDQWLQTPDLPPLVRAGLLTIKGRAADELGDVESAWQAWTEAHDVRPSRFDGAHFSFAVDQLVSAFRHEVFEARRHGETRSKHHALLIVGAPRSGKSLLEQILACHPKIRGAGELRELGTMTDRIAHGFGSRERPYPACIGELCETDWDEMSRIYSDAVEKHAGEAKWLVDTQPTNFLHIGLAMLLDPGVKIIVCRRDPIDTAWACYRTQFADAALDFASSPGGIARYLEGMSRLMRHWQSVCPVEILEVSYEDLVRSPRETVRCVMDYLGLDWDERVMDYARPGRSNLAGAPPMTRPLDASEIGRGAPYRALFGDLIRYSASEGDHVR